MRYKMRYEMRVVTMHMVGTKRPLMAYAGEWQWQWQWWIGSGMALAAVPKRSLMVSVVEWKGRLFSHCPWGGDNMRMVGTIVQ
jgi:hypothetical protein